MPAEMPVQAVNDANAFRGRHCPDLDPPVACSESFPLNAPLELDGSLRLLTIVNKSGHSDGGGAKPSGMQFARHVETSRQNPEDQRRVTLRSPALPPHHVLRPPPHLP